MTKKIKLYKFSLLTLLGTIALNHTAWAQDVSVVNNSPQNLGLAKKIEDLELKIQKVFEELEKSNTKLETVISCNNNGKASNIDATACAGDLGVPSGTIAAFTTACPTGWSIVNAAKGRYLAGAGASGFNVGGTGGSNSITLSAANLPPHQHDSGVIVRIGGSGQPMHWGSTRVSGNTWEHHKNYGSSNQARPKTSVTGSGQPFSIAPAYYALNWCKRN